MTEAAIPKRTKASVVGTTASLRSLVSRFRQQRVLIVGDVMLDETLWGEVSRISPEAPVPVVDLLKHTFALGGAANNAANAISYGGGVELAGVVGDDTQGEWLRKMLADGGVAADGLITEAGRPTTTKTRILAHGQQLVRVDRELRREVNKETEHALLAWLRDRLRGVGACILSDYGKGVVTPGLARGLLRMAGRAKCPVVVDPKGVEYGRYRGAAVVTPNVREAQRAVGIYGEMDADLLEIGRRLRRILPGSAVLITRGAQGMLLFVDSADPLHVRAKARTVFDVTGAGDTVITTLAFAIAAGGSLKQAVQLANRAGGIVVGKLGTATVTLEELSRGL